jgi:hypothetical protein
MPVQSFGHGQYWEGVPSTVVPDPPGPSKGGYPGWQASVVAGSLFGPLAAWWSTRWAQAQWWWALLKRIGKLPPDLVEDAISEAEHPRPVTPPPVPPPVPVVAVPVPKLRVKPSAIRGWWQLGARVDRLSPNQRDVIRYALGLVESEAFPHALVAVKETQRSLGFNKPAAWIPYSRMLKSNPKRAENLFRHVQACERTKATLPSTLSNPDMNLLVELAYHAVSQPWMSSNGLR